MRGEGGDAGSQPMSTAVHRSLNKLWRSNSIFNLCFPLSRCLSMSPLADLGRKEGSIPLSMPISHACLKPFMLINLLKGTVRWFFSLIASYLLQKERILTYFSCCANIYWVMARFNSFGA
jgi:hypothetical protein